MSSVSLSPALGWRISGRTIRIERDSNALQLLSFVAVLVALGFQVLTLLLSDAPATLNLWIPAALAGICIWGVVLLVHANPLWTWSPLVAALAAMAVFHGLGPLLHVFGDPNAIAYANQFAPMNADELARTNLLNIWSLVAMLATFTLFFRLSGRASGPVPARRARRAGGAMRLISWSLVSIALPIKYFVVLPYFLGWLDPNFVLPGFLVVLGNLSLLCLFLFLYHAWLRNAWFYLPATLLFALELATGFLAFNKSEIMTTLGVVFLGLYFVRPSRALAITAMTAIAVVYFLITPIVSRARNFLHSEPASFAERVDALQLAWEGNGAEPANTQGWWTRLCYANAQAFAMRQYDAGIPGETFGLILPALVPRILWPDKPIMTPGFEFNRLVTRNRRSSSAPGVFAEAYWNGGWPAVFLTAAYLGSLCSWFTRSAFRAVSRRDIRWLPFGIGGLLMGASVTDWFASAYVGGALTYAVYYAAIRLVIPADPGADSR